MKYYILRSGSWDFLPMFCRIVNRNDFTPNYRIIDVGFRLIKTFKR